MSLKIGGGRREPREVKARRGGGIGSDLGQKEEKGLATEVIKDDGDGRRRCCVRVSKGLR